MIALRINTNISAMNAHRQFGIAHNNVSRNIERLSSGLRINRAGDDPAGLAISERMRSQIRGLSVASRNSQDAISLLQTAEGGMQTIQDILQQMNQLAVQAASDVNADIDRNALNAEARQLVEEINDIAGSTQFNERNLLDGTLGADPTGHGGPFTIQTGANAGQTLEFNIEKVSAETLGVDGVNLTKQDFAQTAITNTQSAINNVSMQRANLGALANRLEFRVSNLDNQAENVAAAESRIRDVDMAREMTNFTRNSIIMQASTAMLAQANAIPQSVMSLLMDGE